MERLFKDKRGFTLMEMLVVVGIIGVLVAIAIPTFSAKLHKAEVAADWANVRAYYAEIQLAYMTEGGFLPDDEVPNGLSASYDFYTLHFPLSKMDVKLKAGNYVVWQVEGKGYHVIYHCSRLEHYDSEETLDLGPST